MMMEAASAHLRFTDRTVFSIHPIVCLSWGFEMSTRMIGIGHGPNLKLNALLAAADF